jgi:hypothetical protein
VLALAEGRARGAGCGRDLVLTERAPSGRRGEVVDRQPARRIGRVGSVEAPSDVQPLARTRDVDRDEPDRVRGAGEVARELER